MAENETEKKNPSAKPGGAGNNQKEAPQKDDRETEKKDGAKNAVFESIKHLTENVKALSRRTKILAAIALVAVLVISIVLTIVLNRVTYTALYSGLDADEAGEILGVLKDDGVDAKMQGTDTILVPEDSADELRVTLAAKGYPKTGLNYDLFTSNSDFGSTDIETQTRLQYTLQENIRTTINDMDKIKDSIVIVNLASNSSYVVSKNKTEASAAVMLQLESGEEISDSEALSIAQFVMKSVPNLSLENISIVDSQMNSYDLTGDSSASSSTYSDAQMQLSEQMKSALTDQALKVLEPALGKGNVAVSVNLSLDFDKETQNSVEFSAPIEGETEGMLRSLEETLDKTGNGTGTNGSAGTDSNGVSGTEYMATNSSGDYSNNSSKTYNYELNELQTQIEKAQGKVADLSVSVLLNSDADGASAAQTEVENLVANAIGVKPEYISVASLPFVESASGNGFEDYFAQSQSATKWATLLGIAKIVLVCLTILLAVVLVLHFLKKRRGDQEEDDQNPELLSADTDEENLDEAEPTTTQSLLADLAQKKSGQTEKVEKLVEDYPEAAVQILRNWLTED